MIGFSRFVTNASVRQMFFRSVMAFVLIPATITADESQIVDAIVNDDTGQVAGRALNDLLGLSWSERQSLLDKMRCSSPTIAVHLLWIEHIRSVPRSKKQRRRSSLGLSKPQSLDIAGVHRFLGFVEGNLCVPVPLWWEKMLISPDDQHPTRLGFELPRRWSFEVPLAQETVALRLSSGAERQVSLQINQHKWVNSGEEYICLSAGTGFIVVTDDEIVFLSSEERKVVWKQNHWLPGKSPILTGLGEEDIVLSVSVSLEAKCVTVFGSKTIKLVHQNGASFGDPVFFFEQFSLDEGLPICRFSSNLWGHIGPNLVVSGWQ